MSGFNFLKDHLEIYNPHNQLFQIMVGTDSTVIILFTFSPQAERLYVSSIIYARNLGIGRLKEIWFLVALIFTIANKGNIGVLTRHTQLIVSIHKGRICRYLILSRNSKPFILIWKMRTTGICDAAIPHMTVESRTSGWKTKIQKSSLKRCFRCNCL